MRFNDYWDNGKITGISEAGIETFKGLPIASLAREVCQNSLDAVDNMDNPVYMEFEKIEINNENIPGFEELKEAIEKCYEYGVEQNNSKTIKFFKKAINSVEKNVSILRISDYNTKGLLGSDKENENSPWRNLWYWEISIICLFKNKNYILQNFR